MTDPQQEKYTLSPLAKASIQDECLHGCKRVDEMQSVVHSF